MFVSIYYKPSLFNAHTTILIVHIFMNVNKPYTSGGMVNLYTSGGVVNRIYVRWYG